jgi:hypothetical protein
MRALVSSTVSTLNGVHELTYALDAGDDHVAVVEETRRFEAEPDARGCSSRDDICGFECQSGGQRSDESWNVEDHLTATGVLTGLAVDRECQRELFDRWNLVPGHDPRSDRATGVEGLALEPLPVTALQVPGADIVDDRIAEDMLESGLRRNVTAAGTNDQSNSAVSWGPMRIAVPGPMTAVGGLLKNCGTCGSPAPAIPALTPSFT